MLIITALLLVSSCLAWDCATQAYMSVHQADVFPLKCDALLYRSVVRDNACYFAINKPVAYSDGQSLCRDVFATATIHTNKDAASILGAMHLSSADYHSETTYYAEKSVLCRYVNPFTCNSDERTEMPGRCMKRFDPNLNFRDASKFCIDRGSRLPWIKNDEENSAVALVSSTSSSPSWVDQSVIEREWKAAVSEPVEYFRWLFGDAGMEVKCGENIAATVSTKMKGSCVAYSLWETAKWEELRQVICVRPADSCFNPPRPSGGHPHTLPPPPTLPPPTEPTTTETTTTTTESTTSTTTEETTTSTTTEPTTTTKEYPKNNPPQAAWTWILKFYYNWGRILHGFCADPVGCNQMFRNGIGYDGSKGSGNIGRTITREGMKRMPEVCSANHGQLRPLSFRLNGVGYLYNFNNQGIFAGYVALKAGICGAKLGIRVYSCAVSPDAMYGQSLEWNTWYKGRQWGNAPVFWLW